MKIFALITLLFPAVLAAQVDSVFTVKKPDAKWVAGYYCSDNTTDGRICFHFDTLYNVSTTTAGNNVSNIAVQFANGADSAPLSRYSVTGDTLKFVSVAKVSGIGLQKNGFGTMTTTVVGLIKGSEIAMKITAQINGRSPATREVTIYRVKQ